MSGAKYFTQLDASSGYWQIKVDRESSNLLTFGIMVYTPPVKFFRKLFRQ